MGVSIGGKGAHSSISSDSVAWQYFEFISTFFSLIEDSIISKSSQDSLYQIKKSQG